MAGKDVVLYCGTSGAINSRLLGNGVEVGAKGDGKYALSCRCGLCLVWMRIQKLVVATSGKIRLLGRE